MIRELFLAALVVLTLSRSDGCSCSEYFMIKHVHSGLCLTNDANRAAKLETCHQKDTRQVWKWSGIHGKHLSTQSGCGIYGLFTHLNTYSSNQSMAHVQVGHSHYGSDHSWVFEKGYFKNGFTSDNMGITDLRLLPMEWISQGEGQVYSMHSGEVNGNVGSMNWSPENEHDSWFKWKLENLPNQCQATTTPKTTTIPILNPAEPFTIRHVWSGLCIGTKNGWIPVLAECDMDSEEQKWFVDRGHLMNKENGLKGMYLAVSPYNNNRKTKGDQAVGPVYMATPGNDEKFDWEVSGESIKNLWELDQYDLNLIPMVRPREPNGAVGMGIGVKSTVNAIPEDPKLMEWEIINV